MKHLITIFAGLSIVMLAVGCSSGVGSDAVGSDPVSMDSVPQFVTAAEADTLAYCVGYLNGSDVNVGRSRMQEEGEPNSAYTAEDYMRGFSTALNADEASAGYTQGVQAAREIIFKIEELRGYGVEINREMLYKALEQEFSSDTVAMSHMQDLNSAYNQLLQRAYDMDPR